MNPCPVCGKPEPEHRGTWYNFHPLGHGYRFSRIQRFTNWLAMWVWASKRSMYVLGQLPSPF